jgi:hypothetical protein
VAVTVVVELVAGALLVASTWQAGPAPAIVAAGAVGLLAVRAGAGLVRGGTGGAVAGLLLGAVALAALVADGPGDAGAARALCGVAVLALACGSVPAVATRRAVSGGRDVLGTLLVWTAVAAGLAVVAASYLVDALPVDDPRLVTLTPYAAAAGGLLALADALANHRIGAGRPWTPAVMAVVAVLVGAWLASAEAPDRLEVAVQAQVLAALVASVGLLVATATASPRPAIVPQEEAGDGPRLVGPIVGVLVLLAVAIRVAVSRPLWIDEAALARVSDRPLDRLWDAAVTADAHPPLYELVLWASQRMLGQGELALRAPSIAAGLLLVPALYLTARELYDRRVAVVSAAVAALSPALIWLSGAARPGMLAALLATLSLWAMLRAIRLSRSSDWLLFASASIALVATHQLGMVHVAVLLVAAGLAVLAERRQEERDRRLLPGWLLSTALVVGACALLVGLRGGFGPPAILPPFEYATSGAPGAGRSVFGLAGTALVAVGGFHPPEVTSRLLALWPLCMLATFVLFGRRWSQRGALLLCLAVAPFVALLVLQVVDAPRSPPFALEWVATAVPILVIGCGRAVTLVSRWRHVRWAVVAATVVLLAAVADQTFRVRVDPRFDVTSLVDDALRDVESGDLVVHAPDVIGDLVAREAGGARTDSLADLDDASVDRARRVVVIGAFAFDDDRSLEPTLDLVRRLASERELVLEIELEAAKAWVFE